MGSKLGTTERKSVIVVGAGASQEFNLPTGIRLTKILSENLSFARDRDGMLIRRSGKPDLLRAIQMQARRVGQSSDVYIEKASLIAQNMHLAPSIDNFLDTHRNDDSLVFVGKLGIAHAIMEAECKSTLRIDERNIYNRLAFSKTTETWAAAFFKIIAAKRDFPSFLRALANITFIVFNYDRCIEQFFINAAISYFDLNVEATQKVSDAIQIIHPYGSLGPLSLNAGRTSGFAPTISPEGILAAAQGLRTFTEGVDDHDIIARKNYAFSTAELVIFLGFSFIDINMDLLRPKNCGARRVLATAKGRSKDTKTRLYNELSQNYLRPMSRDIELFEGKCNELFYEYDHYLMEQ